MPAIHHRPIDRRKALKLGALAGLGTLVNLPSRAEDESPGSFHLALLSDTHTPGNRDEVAHGTKPWHNLQRIVPDVLRARPDGVILNGDAARTEGLAADYRELKGLLDPVAAQTPVFIGMGNHDDRKNFHGVFTAGQVKSEVRGKQVLVIEHPAVRVLVLDSLFRVNKVEGLLGKAQRDWLALWLDRNNDRPVVVFVHHTLGDGDGELLDSDRMFAVLDAREQVKAVFYGHSHVWSLTRRNRLHLVNLPAVGYHFSDKQPIGWVDATFDAKGVDLTLHAIGGNMAEDGKRTRLDWT